ncbi:putative deoxyribonuclease TATDN1-like isoform X4 [Capsicum annuum]|nr:putative deoxyribonuclease TATDN1-like isoform X4 [Capsicum annuum]
MQVTFCLYKVESCAALASSSSHYLSPIFALSLGVLQGISNIIQLTVHQEKRLAVLRPMMKLFDSHCHLQDPRIINMVLKIIKTTIETGVVHFAVNDILEKDWHLVKEMSELYPCIVPNFGLHPWFITERTLAWLKTLRGFLEATSTAVVGEISLDKDLFGRKIDFADQVSYIHEGKQAKKMLKSIPQDRILLEIDGPNALPKLSNPDSLNLIKKETIFVDGISSGGINDGNPYEKSSEEDKGNEQLKGEEGQPSLFLDTEKRMDQIQLI